MNVWASKGHSKMMGPGGRWEIVVLLLGASFIALEARAGEGGPSLVFDASAASLPQDQVRAEIERELGRPLATTGETASSELAVFVDAEYRLVVRYSTAHGSLDRYLPMPNEESDIALIIALAAGNLVRDQTAGVAPAGVATPSVSKAPPLPTASKGRPIAAGEHFPRHLFGLHLAQDIAWIGGSNVCDPNLGQASDNYACFYQGTRDEPFYHTPYPYEDGIETGLVLATTRLLASYDFAVSKVVSVGARLGYAFRGGPPAGQAPVVVEDNLNELPAHTKGSGGTPFLPAHAELRVTGWVIPLGRRVSAYVGGGFGVAQVDARTTVAERDCAATLDPGWDPAGGSFSECRTGDPAFDWEAVPRTPVDAWKKLGQGFVAASFGGLLHLGGSTGVLANLNAMYMLPSTGIVFEPSLGVVTGLPKL